MLATMNSEISAKGRKRGNVKLTCASPRSFPFGSDVLFSLAIFIKVASALSTSPCASWNRGLSGKNYKLNKHN